MTAIRLGDLLPAHRLGFVFPLSDAFQKFLPVFSQPGQRILKGHSIDSRRSIVGAHPLGTRR